MAFICTTLKERVHPDPNGQFPDVKAPKKLLQKEIRGRGGDGFPMDGMSPLRFFFLLLQEGWGLRSRGDGGFKQGRLPLTGMRCYYQLRGVV